MIARDSSALAQDPRLTTQDPIPGHADAVVVGAGAFGLSAGFFLAQHGYRNVVVLDQYEPGTQTSARAAGLFKSLQANETKTRLMRRSIEIVKGFQKETGVAVPFVQPGSLFIARTPEHAS